MRVIGRHRTRGTYSSNLPVWSSSTIAFATSSGSAVVNPRAAATPE